MCLKIRFYDAKGLTFIAFDGIIFVMFEFFKGGLFKWINKPLLKRLKM